jgi:hypothetical protein
VGDKQSEREEKRTRKPRESFKSVEQQESLFVLGIENFSVVTLRCIYKYSHWKLPEESSLKNRRHGNVKRGKFQ